LAIRAPIASLLSKALRKAPACASSLHMLRLLLWADARPLR
jgi:hypothetical protein